MRGLRKPHTAVLSDLQYLHLPKRGMPYGTRCGHHCVWSAQAWRGVRVRMSTPQDPPYPFPPPPPFPVPKPGEPEPDGDDPQPAPLPSLTTRDPRVDPQQGDALRGLDGQLRQVIRREGDNLWCQDGAMRYKTTVQRWREQWRVPGRKKEYSRKTWNEMGWKDEYVELLNVQESVMMVILSWHRTCGNVLGRKIGEQTERVRQKQCGCRSIRNHRNINRS